MGKRVSHRAAGGMQTTALVRRSSLVLAQSPAHSRVVGQALDISVQVRTKVTHQRMAAVLVDNRRGPKK